MKYLYSNLQKKKYLAEMKQKFDNSFLNFEERLRGFVIGPFFAVAHYQSYEWNRRITSECNRAWGFVREADGELEICFVRGKGMLAPIWFLAWTLFCRMICLFVEVNHDYTMDGIITWILSAVCALIVCAVSAVQSCLTEEGEAGSREVIKFLTNPEEYY